MFLYSGKWYSRGDRKLHIKLIRYTETKKKIANLKKTSMHKVHGVEDKVSTNVGRISNPPTGCSIFNSSITQKYMYIYKSQDVVGCE